MVQKSKMVELKLLSSSCLSTTTSYESYLILFITTTIVIIIFPLLSLLRFASLRTPSLSNLTPCPPESYPLVGNLPGFLRNRHRFHDWVTDMLSSVDFLSPLTIKVNGVLGLSHGVFTVDPANIQHMLRSNFHNYVKGSRFYSVLEELLGHGIFNVDGDIWTVQRKIASHEFNTKSLKKFISNTVQSHLATRLIPLLSSACHDNNIIDLQDIFRKFTFDNICNVAFGIDPECLLSNNMNISSNSSFVRAFDYAVEVNSDRFMSPLALVWKIKRVFNFGSERKYKEAIEIINDYAMNIIRSKERDIQTKLAGEEQTHDLLSRFMFSSSDLGFIDQDEKRKFLRDMAISFILAGKDSTSTALTWFFWLIAGHPQCEQLIYNELLTVASSSPSNSPKVFSYDELKNLHYLHASISESLRLFPPVPMNSRLSISEDILPDGTHVGKGWFADYSAYAMGRSERVWGPDCREFKPERWLNSEGIFQPSDQFKFPVFHCGPRLCLGKEMAYVQMKSVAAALIYEFKVEAMNGGGRRENLKSPPYVLSLILKMRGGLPVRLKRRHKF